MRSTKEKWQFPDNIRSLFDILHIYSFPHFIITKTRFNSILLKKNDFEIGALNATFTWCATYNIQFYKTLQHGLWSQSIYAICENQMKRESWLNIDRNDNIFIVFYIEKNLWFSLTNEYFNLRLNRKLDLYSEWVEHSL